jgi:hypothetical protein
MFHITYLLPTTLSPCGFPQPLPHQTSKLPGASSLLRVRCIISEWTQTQKSSTACVLGGLISADVLFIWWSGVWEISGVQINWECWSSYRVALFLSFFQSFPNLTTGVSSFCPLVGCTCLVSFCEHSIASVIVSGLRNSSWAASQFESTTGPSFSQAPLHFHPCSSFRQEQLWVRILTEGWQTPPSFDALSSCCWWAL